jgi:apolipoprotein N-acyltransferase
MEFANRRLQFVRAVCAFALTAVLVWFGNGLNPVWPLMWFAPLPILWFSLDASWFAALLVAFAAWFAGSGSILPEFRMLGAPGWVWPVSFGGLAALVAIGVLLFRALVRRGRVWAGVLALPALMVSVDWLRNWITPHGTGADFAYTQLRFLPFLQLASITGPWGMSFVLLLVPAAAVACLYLWTWEPRRARQMLAVVSGGLAVILLFGTVRLLESPSEPTVRVGLIAADPTDNNNPVLDGEPALALLRSYAAAAQGLVRDGAEVIVMPEKAVFAAAKDQAAIDGIFQPLADSTGTAIVLGELAKESSGGKVQRFNRAEIYQPRAPMATYDKEHMLPPFESNLTPGHSYDTFEQNGAAVGVAICKDMDFTSMGRAYGKLNAGLMLVPAWDFNVDRVWHGHMAVMRGVESGFGVARTSKDGNLTISDNRGRVIAERRSNDAAFSTLLATVPARHSGTVFLWFGDWFAWVAVAALGFVLVSLVRRA